MYFENIFSDPQVIVCIELELCVLARPPSLFVVFFPGRLSVASSGFLQWGPSWFQACLLLTSVLCQIIRSHYSRISGCWRVLSCFPLKSLNGASACFIQIYAFSCNSQKTTPLQHWTGCSYTAPHLLYLPGDQLISLYHVSGSFRLGFRSLWFLSDLGKSAYMVRKIICQVNYDKINTINRHIWDQNTINNLFCSFLKDWVPNTRHLKRPLHHSAKSTQHNHKAPTGTGPHPPLPAGGPGICGPGV